MTIKFVLYGEFVRLIVSFFFFFFVRYVAPSFENCLKIVYERMVFFFLLDIKLNLKKEKFKFSYFILSLFL